MGERGLFRWPGGKKHLVEKIGPVIVSHLAATGGRLVSLFAGSLAIERAVGHCAVAADASPELLQLYDDMQKHSPMAVHAALLKYAASAGRSTPDGYRRSREVFPDARLPLTSSARFLWLSAMAFNGVWRVNSDGVMNMPPDPARLDRGLDALPPLAAFEKFAEEIRGITFLRGWDKAFLHARAGDLLFADPPYGEFAGYTADGFSSKDHRLLAGALRGASSNGIGVIAFNAPEAAPIYHWAKVEEVTRSGAVSSKVTERDPVTEIIVTAGLRGGER